MKSLIIAGRLIRQINGDKRTLGIMIMAPILISSILYIFLSSDPNTIYIDVVGQDSGQYDSLRSSAEVTFVRSEEEAVNRLEDGKNDGYINGDHYVAEGTDPTINALVYRAFAGYNTDRDLSSLPSQAKEIIEKINVPVKVDLYYSLVDLDRFDFFAPNMMGFIIFFLVFLLAGIAFLRERISGTLEKIMATSLKRSELVTGYFIGFGAFALLQTVVIQAFFIYVLKIHSSANFLLVLLINLAIAGVSLTLGTLMSAFARNEFQLFQFIPMIIIPQMMFSGIFSMRETPLFFQYLAKLFPLTYGADALKEVMIRGKGLDAIWTDLLIIIVFTAIFIVLNIRVLRKYRDI